MSSAETNAPVLNFNFFIQNNIHVNSADLNKSKPGPFARSQSPSTFEFKERAKKPTPFEFEEKNIQKKLLSLTATQSTEDSLTQTEASTPKATIKTENRESEVVYEGRSEPFENDSITELLGYTFLIGAGVFFVLTMFAFFGSSIIGKTGHIVLDFLMEDSYYCFLVPLLVPLTIILTYLNWLSIKFFRHT
jgi:hypothetical protein